MAFCTPYQACGTFTHNVEVDKSGEGDEDISEEVVAIESSIVDEPGSSGNSGPSFAEIKYSKRDDQDEEKLQPSIESQRSDRSCLFYKVEEILQSCNSKSRGTFETGSWRPSRQRICRRWLKV